MIQFVIVCNKTKTVKLPDALNAKRTQSGDKNSHIPLYSKTKKSKSSWTRKNQKNNETVSCI